MAALFLKKKALKQKNLKWESVQATSQFKLKVQSWQRRVWESTVMNMAAQTTGTHGKHTAELAVAEGYESRSWLCMFCPHSWGRHHIASSGQKWTCLFRLVQRIITPPPPPPTFSHRYPTPQLHLNKSEWLTAPVNVITYRSEWDHVSSTHPREQQSHSRGSAGEQHFQIWKGREGGFHAGQVTGRCRFCHRVNQKKRWYWCKSRRGSMSSWHLHGLESTN